MRKPGRRRECAGGRVGRRFKRISIERVSDGCEMTYCVIVRTHGRELDRLRGDASRIARDQKADWWVETRDEGAAFCFEDATAKNSFNAVCERDNIQYTEA